MLHLLGGQVFGNAGKRLLKSAAVERFEPRDVRASGPRCCLSSVDVERTVQFESVMFGHHSGIAAGFFERIHDRQRKDMCFARTHTGFPVIKTTVRDRELQKQAIARPRN